MTISSNRNNDKANGNDSSVNRNSMVASLENDGNVNGKGKERGKSDLCLLFCCFYLSLLLLLDVLKS